MAEDRDEQPVRIGRVDDDLRDLLRIAQTEVRPVRPAVGRFVHPVADREIGALQPFAAAGVDRVGRGRRDRERADRCRRLIVEERRPGAPRVGRLEDPAVYRRDEEGVRPAGDAADRDGAAAAKRTDRAPMQNPVERRQRDRRRERRRGQGENGEGDATHPDGESSDHRPLFNGGLFGNLVSAVAVRPRMCFGPGFLLGG